MSERLTMPLWDPVQAHKAITHIYNTAKPYLMAGHRMVVRLEPETRRDNHNRHFHSLISQIAQQMGERVPDLADAEDAKRILISRPVSFHPVCCYQQPSARLTFAFNCPPPVSWARR